MTTPDHIDECGADAHADLERCEHIHRPRFGEWLTLDIRPVADGWRAVYFIGDERGAFTVEPLAGWLVQAQNLLWLNCFAPVEGQPPLAERPRRVVAGIANPSGIVDAVDDDDENCHEFWCLLEPGTEVPDHDDALREHERRQGERAARTEAADLERAFHSGTAAEPNLQHPGNPPKEGTPHVQDHHAR